MVPEDQAQYVCEAQNVFGKVRAEAQLVVTGHGSLVELGEEGLVGRSGPPGRSPPVAAHPLGQMRPCQALREEPLEPSFLGSVPQNLRSRTLEDPSSRCSHWFPREERGAVAPLCPR